MKLSKKRRKELIDEVLTEIYSNLHCYRDFVLDCVREEVESWTDEDLVAWADP